MNVSKVLVVDDSKVVRVGVKRMLETRGLGVDMASSGQEALEYLVRPQAGRYFHGLDGGHGRLRGHPMTQGEFARPPPFRWSCAPDRTRLERARARECGASDFVTKPIDERHDGCAHRGLRKLAVARPPCPAKPVAEVAVPVPAEERFGLPSASRKR